jgi:hypothetical protein
MVLFSLTDSETPLLRTKCLGSHIYRLPCPYFPGEIEGQYWQSPTDILIHPQSSFHFDVRDASRTRPNPNPPSGDLAAIRYPTWLAFFDMVVDTLFHPPVEVHESSSGLSNCEIYLVMYALSNTEDAPVENEPYHGDYHTSDLTRLLPQCWKALEKVKDENKLYLARCLLDIRGGVCYDAVHIEQSLVQQAQRTYAAFPCICIHKFFFFVQDWERTTVSSDNQISCWGNTKRSSCIYPVGFTGNLLASIPRSLTT